LGTVTGTSINVTGLTAATSYSFYVEAADVAGNISAASNTINVTTAANSTAPTGYCSSNGNDASYEWIDLVQLGSINHSSGSDGGYADNTALSTNLTLGSGNTIYLSSGFSGTSYTGLFTLITTGMVILQMPVRRSHRVRPAAQPPYLLLLPCPQLHPQVLPVCVFQ